MMKNFRIVLSVLFCLVSAQIVWAQKTVRYDLPAFTEISLKNDAKLILKRDESVSGSEKKKPQTDL